MEAKEIGELIRMVRKERGLTLDDLKDDFISRTTISSIERGHTNSRQKVQYLLCKLDIDLTQLSEIEKEKAEEKELTLMILENRINTDAEEALKQLKKLPKWYYGPLYDFLKARCFFKLKQFDYAIKQFNHTLKELEKTIGYEKTNLKPLCLNHLSIIEFNRGTKEKAMRYIEQSLNSFDINGERNYYYMSLQTNKAIYLRSLGRQEDALKALEEIKANPLEIDIDIAIGVYDLKAKLKKDINLYDEAASCARKGLEIARLNYSFERTLELYITLADIYIEKGKLHRAKACLKAGIDLQGKISRRQWLILETYLKLGIVHFKAGESTNAFTLLTRARKIAKRENNMLKYRQALLFIARCHVSELRYDEALSVFSEVLGLCPEEKIHLEALDGVMQVYLLLNDDVNYIKYSKLYYKAKGLNL